MRVTSAQVAEGREGQTVKSRLRLEQLMRALQGRPGVPRVNRRYLVRNRLPPAGSSGLMDISEEEMEEVCLSSHMVREVEMERVLGCLLSIDGRGLGRASYQLPLGTAGHCSLTTAQGMRDAGAYRVFA